MLSKKILILLSFFCFVSVSCAAPVPDFTLNDLNDQTVSLDDYKGKIVFVDFWASWCPPCRQSIPVVESLYEEYKNNKDVVILGINMNEDKSVISQFVLDNNINYKVLIGDAKVASNYNIRGIPAFFIIDQTGKIYNKYVGFAPGIEAKWKEDINKLLK